MNNINLLQLVNEVKNHLNNSDVYYGHGTTSPEEEAFALVYQSLKLPFDDSVSPELVLSDEQITHVHDLLKQRIEQRIPVPYLVNEAYFYGLPFYVDERVLIPRSPLAELIEQRFQPWIDDHQVNHVLDLCTGSGCIAIACALEFDKAQVMATDISNDALAVATMNVEQYELEKRLTLIQSDVFKSISDIMKFDVIISNPPYVHPDEMQTLPEEYLHEPQLALEASDDGLAIVHSILKNAHRYLNKHGVLIVEVGSSEQFLQQYYPDIPFTWLEFERGGEGVFLLTADQLSYF